MKKMSGASRGWVHFFRHLSPPERQLFIDNLLKIIILLTEKIFFNEPIWNVFIFWFIFHSSNASKLINSYYKWIRLYFFNRFIREHDGNLYFADGIQINFTWHNSDVEKKLFIWSVSIRIFMKFKLHVNFA